MMDCGSNYKTVKIYYLPNEDETYTDLHIRMKEFFNEYGLKFEPNLDICYYYYTNFPSEEFMIMFKMKFYDEIDLVEEMFAHETYA